MLWAIAVYDMGLTDEQFWELTPPQFAALSSRHDALQQIEDQRAGIVASTIANCHRDPKAKPFLPKHFMPSYEEPQVEEKTEELTAEALIAQLKAAFPPRPEDMVEEDSGG